MQKSFIFSLYRPQYIKIILINKVIFEQLVLFKRMKDNTIFVTV